MTLCRARADDNCDRIERRCDNSAVAHQDAVNPTAAAPVVEFVEQPVNPFGRERSPGRLVCMLRATLYIADRNVAPDSAAEQSGPVRPGWHWHDFGVVQVQFCE